MGKRERQAYLEAIRKRYRQVPDVADKGKILDEFCSVCGYQRKYAIRLIERIKPAKVAATSLVGLRNTIKPALLTVLRRLWLATDQMCSKRLVAAMPLVAATL